MTLPASGAISLSQVNVELGLSSTATISLNDSSVRTLFGVASGAIAMSDGYGKANQFAFTVSANQTNADLRTLAVNAGWNQSSLVIATINSGVYISSNATGTPALTVSGSFPGGVQLVNGGIIVGMGGAGGAGAHSNGGVSGWSAGVAGSSGGTALSVSTAITITNNGTIAGGGGGGGGGGGANYFANETDTAIAGNGGGGGRSSNAANSAGGVRGYYHVPNLTYATTGGSGTVSAAAGTTTGGGSNGGAGGGWGSSGSSGASVAAGPWGAAAPGGGGSGGNAVSGNSNITWSATGTRLGGIA